MDFRLSTGRWPKSTVLGVVCAVVLALAPVVSAGAAEDGNALKARLAARSLLLDIAAADGHLVAVGERGHILFSDDRGATWTQADVPTTVTLTGVFLLDRNLGWAVGHDAVVLHTADGGRTWTLQRSAPEEERPLFDVYFSDAAHGFAIGAYGAFLATADGGATWTERRISEEDVHLHHIARAPSGALFIAAESGTLFRSDDGGASWRELPSPYEGSLFATVPLEGKALLLLGLRGHLFRSEDGGESWTALASGTEAMLTDGVVLGDGRVVVTGLAGVVLVSEDHGRTFAVHHQPARQGIVAVAPAGDGAIALAGEFGVRKLPAGALAETSR
jgi:photosystem II stability/assembly factor-like uncharacterized protein